MAEKVKMTCDTKIKKLSDHGDDDDNGTLTNSSKRY